MAKRCEKFLKRSSFKLIHRNFATTKQTKGKAYQASAGHYTYKDVPRPHMLIVGGSITGLAAALEFQARRFPVTVFEKRTFHEMSNAGAGLYLAAIPLMLQKLGVHDILNTYKYEPKEFRVQHADGRVITKISATDYFERAVDKSIPWKSFSGAYLYEDLYKFLITQLQGHPSTQIRWGTEVGAIADLDDAVEVHQKDGVKHEGGFLLACDGQMGIVRKFLYPDAITRPTGIAHFYALVDSDKGRSLEDIFLEMPLHGALLTYFPLRGRRFCIHLAYKTKEDVPPIWDAQKCRRPFVHELETRGAPKHMISAVENAYRYIHYGDHKSTSNLHWFDNRILYLGNAAHACSPWMGRNVEQAFTDAACLARIFDETTLAEQEELPDLYEQNRKDSKMHHDFRTRKNESLLVADNWFRKMGRTGLLGGKFEYNRIRRYTKDLNPVIFRW